MAAPAKSLCADPVLRDACLDSLTTFAETMMPSYQAAACHRLLARKLEDCLAGKTRRLCISLPPRFGKSQLASVLFPAWALTKNPQLQVIQASYSSELSEEFSQKAKRVLESEVYAQLFRPILDPAVDRARQWATTAGGEYFSTGVGAGGLGRGADLLICDDLIKGRDEADSATMRDRLWSWFSSTAMTRLSPNGVAIIIGSRWGEEDLIGRLLAKNLGFEMLAMEAICESPETDPLHRAAGESLWPERWPVARLEELKAQLGPREWNSHYQARPAPPGGNFVDVRNVKFIDRDKVPADLTQARGWDLALGVQRSNDWSAGARGGIDREGNLIITDMNRARRPWAAQKEMIIALAKMEGGRVGIETVSAWAIAADEIRAALSGFAVVKNIPAVTSKEARAYPWLSKVDTGNLFLVRAPWNSDFLHELEQFPTGAHDDQVDAVSLLWEMVRKRQTMVFAIPSTPTDFRAHGLRQWRYEGAGGGLRSLHRAGDDD